MKSLRLLYGQCRRLDGVGWCDYFTSTLLTSVALTTDVETVGGVVNAYALKVEIF